MFVLEAHKRVNPAQRKAKPGNGERLNLGDIV